MATCNDVSYSLQTCMITDIQLGRTISQGAYGKILEAKWEGSLVAVKQFLTIYASSAQEFEVVKTKYLIECDRCVKLRHPNVVRIFGACFIPGVRIPSMVMERLHCSLYHLLERRPAIHLDMKTSILHQIGLGLRYLHTRAPPIIHSNLSSKKILISKGMEAKIAFLNSARFIPNMNGFSGCQDFMPPEVLVDDPSIKYGKELDVFSFGCVMLHTFSQQWPTPSQHVVITRSEIERRAQYLDKIHKAVEYRVVPLVVSCLENLPSDRPSIVEVCNQLETLVVNRQQLLPDNLLEAQLMLKEMNRQIHSKDVEIETLRYNLTKLQITAPTQVCKFTVDDLLVICHIFTLLGTS